MSVKLNFRNNFSLIFLIFIFFLHEAQFKRYRPALAPPLPVGTLDLVYSLALNKAIHMACQFDRGLHL